MKLKYRLSLFGLFILSVATSYAQVIPIKVAIFSPIYIDSAFNGNTYQLGDANLPKQILPGLEFYNGAMAAIDSLQKQGVQAIVSIYDTKNRQQPIDSVLNSSTMQGVNFIITSSNDRNDLKKLADFALLHQIPLLSATYPNNAGISNNPFFIILNSTLQTHCREIYKYLQRNHAFDKIILFTRKSQPAEIIQSIFTNMSQNAYSISLKYLTVQLPDSFSVKQITPYMDSTRQNILICGSLNDAFALQLIKAANDAKNYPSLVVGMPTWDAMPGLDQPMYNNASIVYTTPFYCNRTTALYNSIADKYKQQLNSYPSDMMLKGYETVFHFIKVWQQYGADAINHLSDNHFTLFNTFKIQPVRDQKNLGIINYQENQKLYFLKKIGGVIKSVN
ncbi:MAG: hypothetical protein EKK39_04085 [Sphingobacteriales bacterium]|uniref:ABC transporter substrate-binding protein n=1 Tax=Hydrotalea flava TaxID=714549 RepID=UPI00082D4ACF|nr:ABC transporter substrate-binding protein [Hydrotalea flava]RTL54856.1 MAG: hypothetical protein EKK39_04085 [Sphingobacteriales bacterium]